LKARHFILLLLAAGCYACREQHKVVPLITTPDYQKGLSFLNRQNDSAFYYFNKVATGSKDSLQVAMAYTNMAVIQSDAGDYFGSQESLLASLKYLDEQKAKDHHCLLSDYNELGSTSLNLKNYDAAIAYYDQALQFAKDDAYKTIALNNKAVAYQKKKQYSQAIAIYRSIIEQSKKNKKEYARILSNLARVEWLQNPGYPAAPGLLQALQIRKEEKDDWGLNASYAHLSDYYSGSRPDSALLYADKMYAIARQLSSPDDELEALQKLITLSAPKAVKQYFIRYQYLSDSLQTARNAAKNQFALIRYEAEKNKADNLRLQKDNTEKRIQIMWQWILICGVVLVFIILIVFLVSRHRNVIRKQQLKTSQKVHDVVANGLYRLMAEIQHHDAVEKEQLLDAIEQLYDQSRDISYEPQQPENSNAHFQESIAGLLRSFASPGTKVLVVGNHPDIWNGLKDGAKKELEHVLQELMVNMKKHSTAGNVVVRFERRENQLKIQYTDDGIGLPEHFRYGNGLTNTGNRIKDIGGLITFGKHTPKGLKVEITLPFI
jgi:signal transduction histidine kinase